MQDILLKRKELWGQGGAPETEFTIQILTETLGACSLCWKLGMQNKEIRARAVTFTSPEERLLGNCFGSHLRREKGREGGGEESEYEVQSWRRARAWRMARHELSKNRVAAD